MAYGDEQMQGRQRPGLVKKQGRAGAKTIQEMMQGAQGQVGQQMAAQRQQQNQGLQQFRAQNPQALGQMHGQIGGSGWSSGGVGASTDNPYQNVRINQPGQNRLPLQGTNMAGGMQYNQPGRMGNEITSLEQMRGGMQPGNAQGLGLLTGLLAQGLNKKKGGKGQPTGLGGRAMGTA